MHDNMVVFCFGINLAQVHSWVSYDTDWIGWDTQSQVVPVSYRSIDGTVKLQESFRFGDGRELFDTALKYSQPENMWSPEANIIVIHKALMEIMKI